MWFVNAFLISCKQLILVRLFFVYFIIITFDFVMFNQNVITQSSSTSLIIYYVLNSPLHSVHTEAFIYKCNVQISKSKQQLMDGTKLSSYIYILYILTDHF